MSHKEFYACTTLGETALNPTDRQTSKENLVNGQRIPRSLPQPFSRTIASESCDAVDYS